MPTPRSQHAQPQTTPVGRFRLAVLLATVAAFLLVPAGQALADHGGGTNPHLKVNLIGIEGGGGEVVSPSELFPLAGVPPMKCNLPEGGIQEGVCENEMDEGEPGLFGEGLEAFPGPNSEIELWEVLSPGIKLGGETCQPAKNETGCVVAGPASFEVNVYFACEPGKECPPPPIPLTINPVGSGTGQVNCDVNGGSIDEPCDSEYPEGTELELIADEDEGSEFVGFENGSGDAESCTTSPCGPFTLEEESEVDARFDLIPHTLTVEATGEGSVDASEPPAPISGEIAGCEEGGGECSAEYGEGQTVTLEATPGENKVVEWTSGCTSSAGNICEVEIPAGDATVQAEFVAAPPGTLTVEPTGDGSVDAEEPPAPSSGEISGCEEASGECSAEYFQGETITLLATPGEHQQVAWTGCDSEPTANECQVEVDSAAVTVKADFTTIVHTLAVNTAGSGSGSVSCDGGACATSYPEGTEVTLAASADSGSTFAGWSGGGCSGTGACLVTLEADTTVTATFDADAPVVIVDPPPLPVPLPLPLPVENCLTNAALCKPGLLIANGVAFVNGNKALLKVRCRGEVGARCRSVLRLIATVRVRGKKRNILVGQTRYNLPTNSAVRVLRAKLTGRGISLVRRAGHRGLKANLVGKGVRNRVVNLKQQGGGKKQRRSRR